MNLKIFRVSLIIVLIVTTIIPIVQAPNIEVSPTDTTDDAFITGVGNYFGDTPWLFLRDEVSDIVIGTRFRNVAIPQGSKINNATLLVRTVYTYGAANNITVTITGDDADDSAPFNDSGSFSRTFTLAFEVWNISDVHGNQWHNVSVTEIVQEIIDRVGWVSGNSLSLIIFTDKGIPRRDFASIDGNPAYTPILNITYGEDPSTPQDQANPPFNDTDKFDWEYNGTYRGIDIWFVFDTNTSGNRGTDSVNWRRLNLTQLTEIDSGAAITVNNASWASLSAFQAQQINSLYNDTGGLGVAHFYAQFGVNLSAITNPNAFSDRVATVVGISTSTPVGAAGLLEGAAGNFAGVVITVNSDDERYTFRLADRAGINRQYRASSQTFEEDDNEILYISYAAHIDWHVFHIYENPDFSGLLFRSGRVYANGFLGPFRYPQVISSLGFGLVFINQGEYYTFPNFPEAEPLIQLIYPNGTFVTPDPVELPTGFTPDDIEDIIDDLLGGAQPEDPQEDEYPVLSRFRWKLLVLVVGMIMLLGSPIAGITYGADTATWIKLFFVMFFGLGILLQIKFM